MDLDSIVESLPLGRNVKVLNVHPLGLIALEKPCSILSHPNVDTDRNRSLLRAGWSKDRERFAWKIGDQSVRFYLLHRLDSATSGVILGCVNPNLVLELKKEFSKRRVSKTYMAIVGGLVREDDTLWRDTLRKRMSGSRLRVDANARGGGLAETRVKVVETKHSDPRLSLLKLNPLTGRTHQLRVQSAKRKTAILGDTTYGDFPFNRKVQKAVGEQRLFLHATSIRIRWEWRDREYVFEADSEVPEIFNQVMKVKY
jgi:tRNA pseudouridine65 synthase